MTNHCAFCGAEGVEPTTTAIQGGYGGVTVTVAGVPATRCVPCGEVGVRGPVAETIDRAMTNILVATEAIPATSAAIEAADADEDAVATSAVAAVAGLAPGR